MAETEQTAVQTPATEMDQAVASAVAEASAPARAGGDEADGSSSVSMPKCAKCKVESKVEDMICRPSFRVELRYVCRPCHAVGAQFHRKGVQLTELLDEDSLVSFFAECALERKNAEDGRVTFARARATLKKCMVQEVRRTKRDAREAEWQPLSYYELKGYDVDRIQATCPYEDNEALGRTYKVAIHKESDETLHAQAEQRITQMEAEALRRRAEAAAAPGVPALDLDEAIEAAAGKRKRQGGLTESEKEEQKKLKKLRRQRETERKVATAAAAKLLPTLKACLDKVETKLQRLKDAPLPLATLEQAASARETLQTTVASATKLLNAAASGKSLEGLELDFKKEKDLQNRVKDGNAAVRALQEFVRAQNSEKENAKPNKGKGKGRGRKNDA